MASNSSWVLWRNYQGPVMSLESAQGLALRVGAGGEGSCSLSVASLLPASALSVVTVMVLTVVLVKVMKTMMTRE